MNIIEAAKAMQNGKKVRRSCWGKSWKTYIYFADDYMTIGLHTTTGEERLHEIMGDDLLACVAYLWVVVAVLLVVI